jgi:hypothetical protein
MKPLPIDDRQSPAAKPIPGLPITPTPGSFSSTNRRAGSCRIQRAYPWMLFSSTAVAATFCLAYITKPVILPNPSPADAPVRKEVAANVPAPSPVSEKLMPDPARLPGDSKAPEPGSTAESPPAVSLTAEFEETNIRVQHILDAESPTGDISRIIVDVPVLYRSRNLRWSQSEAAEARALLARLSEHQEKTRALRDEGKALLHDWNTLMGASIPTDALRADSPSLPSNQHDPLAPVGSSAEETIDTIKLSEPEK